MTLGFYELLLYSIAIFVLFLTPGPVWVAIVARSLSGGLRAAWPLASGVAIGDALWSLLAMLGMALIINEFNNALMIMRWLACGIFILMGAVLIRNTRHTLSVNNSLVSPGALSGFLAGLAVIIGNPKAILFYMGILPGFFDLNELTGPDVFIIAAISAIIPMTGNLAISASVGQMRVLLHAPRHIFRMNMSAGTLLILVGLAIPFI